MRLLLALLLLAGSMSPQQVIVAKKKAGYATPAIVQECPSTDTTPRNNGATDHLDMACASDTTLHNSLLCWAQGDDATTNTLSIADTASDSYTAIAGPTRMGGIVFYLWLAPDIAVQVGNVITVTDSAGTSDLYGHCGEFSGLTTTNSFDQTASANGLDSGNAPSTTVATELVLGIGRGGNGGTAPTVGPGYNLIASTNSGSRNPAWEYRVVTSIGTYNATFATGTSLNTAVFTLKAKGL